MKRAPREVLRTEFSDLNLHKDGADRWVNESQVNIRLTPIINLVIEGRYNGFEENNPALDGSGVAGGFSIEP